MSQAPDARPLLTIENLNVTLANGRPLLEHANLRVNEGDFVVLAGPSGAGKSTLLKLIAQIEDYAADKPVVTGTIHIHADDGSRGAARQQVGLVFQNHALFDELSAEENVRFALDHRADAAGDSKAKATEWLQCLHVPLGVPLSRLSGGERQRVALARTLALDPAVILFDEPTTGLDLERARAVVDLLTEVHRESRKTIIVVTHDFAPFLKNRPRLVLVDPRSHRLHDVNEQELRAFFEQDARPQTFKEKTVAGAQRVTRELSSWLEAPGAVLITLFIGLYTPFTGARHAYWKLRYLWHYARMVLIGPTAIYVAIAGIMLGFVSVTFTFKQLPYGQVTRPLLTEEFLAATGYSSFRVIVPLLVGVLIAGKCGAAIAADVGARRLTLQFEAMQSMGVRPENYLFGNIVIALCVAAPLLTILAFLSSTAAALIAYLLSVSEGSVAVFRRNYFATVWPITHVLPKGTDWVLIKGVFTGFLVAGLSYLIGASPKRSSVEVSRDVGRTIFWASLVVLLLHSIFSFIEF